MLRAATRCVGTPLLSECAFPSRDGVKLDAAREARRRSLDERDDEVAVAPAAPPAEDEVAADAILALFRRVSTLEVDKAEGSKVLQLSDRLKNCVASSCDGL